MEYERVMIDAEDIQSYFACFSAYIQDCAASLIINIDESGLVDWVDIKYPMVVVQISYEVESIHYPIKRSCQRKTLLVGISAAGTLLKPMMILGCKIIEINQKKP